MSSKNMIMDFIQAIILGIVQGITEWLPVSSSAHLAIAGRIFQADADLFFFVLLHAATLLSMVLYFRRKIISFFIDEHAKLTKQGIYVLYASIPVFIAGYLLHGFIEAIFTNFFFIGLALIANSAVLFITKYFRGKEDIKIGKSIFVGFMQVFSLIPGISRSGITISSGIFSGMKKESAMMFSFMLAIPAISGAFVYQLIKTPFAINGAIIAGFTAAIISGYIALGILIKKIKQGEFYRFWTYCLILGIIMLFN
jgi:undecaprenyl-diphosphatase